MLVLLIDDSGFQRKQVKRMLQSESHETIEAGDGLEALTLFQSHQPDLVLCDLLMPNMSGFEYLHAQSKLGSSTPTLILTADIQEGVKEQCMGLGAAGLINKPIKKERLLEAINVIMPSDLVTG